MLYKVVELDDLIDSQTDDMAANNPAYLTELRRRDRTCGSDTAVMPLSILCPLPNSGVGGITDARHAGP